MNYYFARYVRWDTHDNKDYALEFLLPAATAADAKVFCDVAATEDAHGHYPEFTWRLASLTMADEAIYEKADHRSDWSLLSHGSTLKRRFRS